MLAITISLREEQLRKFQGLAARLGVSLDDLVRASLEDLLARPTEQFRRAVDHVLAENADLYRRLE